MPDLYQFNEDDIALMKELIREHRNKRLPLRSRVEEQDDGAPEVYVVRTPAAGIAAASSGTLTGTGSAALRDDSFSSATCRAYTINTSAQPRPTGKTIKVYNVSESAIPGDTWVVAQRDKFGKWIANWAEVGTIQEDSFTVVTDCSFNPTTCVFTKVTSLVTVRGRDIDVTVS